jgi:signal transduction histidine kinase
MITSMVLPDLLRGLVRDLVRTVATGDDPPMPRPSGQGRWPRLARLQRVLPLPVFMLLLAVGLAMAQAANAPDLSGPVALSIGVISTLPLLLVVRHSLWAWRLAWLAAVGLGASWHSEQGAAWPWNPVQFVVLLFVLLVVAARHDRGVLGWVWVLSVALPWVFVDTNARIGVTLLFTGLLVLGDQVGRRWQAQRRLAVEQERGAVLTERARIARELHDVVAHHMSLIAVRAESAPYRVGEVSAAARGEFVEIADGARAALVDMRRLLGVLRDAGEGGDGGSAPAAATAPQPGLADLAALVDAARQAGAEVTMQVRGSLTDLPAAADVSAYRIVQEAMSNATRHAAGAPVTVVVHRADDRLDLRVTNAARRGAATGSGAGSGQRVASGPGPGLGLRGMRERAAMLGGEVSTVPTADGGFEVLAYLPLHGAQP